MNLKKLLNWRFKIIAKLILSKLPLPYSLWKKIALFEHGAMENPEYCLSVFKAHYDAGNFNNKGNSWNALELGPGDSLAMALIAKCFGANKVYLVDVGAFANTNIDDYKTLAKYLAHKGYNPPDISSVNNFQQLLEKLNAIYLINGLNSLGQIADNEIDFCFSQAVLEHVRRHEFDKLTAELKRVINPEGLNSHRVDLRDHLQQSLNNLRFSDKVWESDFFSSAGFYTNRLRYCEIVESFKDSGFGVKTPVIDRWERLPLPRRKMNKQFQEYSDEELCISGFNLIAKL